MIFDGGITGGVTILLLSVAASAAIAFLIQRSTLNVDNGFHISIHLAFICIYAPTTTVIVNQIPGHKVGTRAYSVSLLLLLLTIFTLFHYTIALKSRKDRRIAEIAADFKGLKASLADAQRETSELKDLEKARDTSLRSLEDVPHKATPARVLVNRSVADYRSAVVSAESRARESAFIQWRIAPYFKSEDTINYLAQERFGEGSPDAANYRDEHLRRRQAFQDHLLRGDIHREIYPRDRLLSYVKTGTHSRDMWPLPAEQVIDLLNNWRDAIVRHDNYFVAISDESLPFKYHLIDGECIILHEPIGKGDSMRVNSIFIYDPEAANMLLEDFEFVWSQTPPKWRASDQLASWIETDLLPLASRRLSDADPQKPKPSRGPDRDHSKLILPSRHTNSDQLSQGPQSLGS